MFYSVGSFRTSSLGVSISSRLERTALRRWGEESGYVGVCNKGQVVWTSKLFGGIKENQLPQVKEFSTFLYMGRCKGLGSLKSVLFIYISAIWGPVSCNFSHPEFFRSPCREWLYPDGCWITQARFYFTSVLEGWDCWWLWHPCLLIWQEIFHFSDAFIKRIWQSLC